MNSVRLYSNGTAVISREVTFPDGAPLRVAIPVRKADLDDVVSSLTIFGAATVAAPPTYTPTNAEAPTLTVEPANALRDLATKLAGAAVEVEAGTTYKGRLVGLHSYRREVQGATQQEYRLVVLTERGVQQVAEAAITAFRFTEPAVQAEVDKALRASLGRIKPDSSQVELTLQPHPGATGAVVSYATPVAAWKIRYQLRLTPEGAELDGQAVVDNDTDDDWTDAQITVITGEPITFSTDLAEVRRPARSRVTLVADRATGAVVAEPEMVTIAASPPKEVTRGGIVRDASPAASYRKMSQAGGAGAALSVAAPPGAGMERAEAAGAEARESGDFSLFTSPDPVSVGAGRSAILPLFRVAAADPRPVLLYREGDDPRRPFRAVRFRNDAAHALGRGICEVFVAGDFQGKCLLEPTRPGAEVLLVHAKETGVAVFKHAGRPATRRLSIRIGAGTVSNQVRHRQRTTYRIKNDHAEAFNLEIEHPRAMPDSELSATAAPGAVEAADIPSGRRFRVALPPGGAVAVEVREERIEAVVFQLKTASWLVANLIGSDAPTEPGPEVLACVELQRAIDRLEAELREREAQAKTCEQEQERLIKLIPNAHAEQANAWRTDLADVEQELREIRRATLPRLRAQLKEAKDALHEALARLQYAWDEPPKAGRKGKRQGKGRGQGPEEEG